MSDGTAGPVARRLVNGTELDAMVTELVDIVRKTGLARTLAIGELILTRVFSGRAEVWRARRRNKNSSVRRLAERPGCPLSRSALNQAIGVYVAVRALPCVQTSGHIGASHVVAVLPLDDSERDRWLRRAEIEQWSVRRLKVEIIRERRLAGERRGRPRSSEATQGLAAVMLATKNLEVAVANMSGTMASSLEASALERSAQRIAAVAERLLKLSNEPPTPAIVPERRPAHRSAAEPSMPPAHVAGVARARNNLID